MRFIRAIFAAIVTIIVGIVATSIFAGWINAPEIGPVIAVAVMGAFIIAFSDNKQ